MDGLSNEIIARAQSGDAEAFKIVYEFHKARVFAICLRMTRTPVDAEDLTQEVFLHLFRSFHTFRWEAKFSSWLYRLTVSVALWKLRPKQINTTPLDYPDEGYRIDCGTADSNLVNAIDRLVISRAIADLPRACRVTFVLHEVFGYHHKEIAAITGTGVATSKSHLHRARLRLRETLLKRTNGQRSSYSFQVSRLTVCTAT